MIKDRELELRKERLLQILEAKDTYSGVCYLNLLVGLGC